MKRIIIAIAALVTVAALVALAPSLALAQDAPHAPHADTDPNLPGVHGEHAPAKADGHADDHHGDPTEHFNFTTGILPWEWSKWRGSDIYGGKLGDGQMTDPKTGKTTQGEEGMSPPFVLLLLNFGILLLILAKFGGPVARRLAEERHDQIKTALDEAARLREAAAKKLAEYETRIKDVDAEVKKLVDGIRADAEADKQRIIEASAAQAAQMKRDAELRIAAEIELARAQLTKEVTAAAAAATEKLLRDKVTGDDQTRLVTTFISNVQSQEAR